MAGIIDGVEAEDQLLNLLFQGVYSDTSPGVSEFDCQVVVDTTSGWVRGIGKSNSRAGLFGLYVTKGSCASLARACLLQGLGLELKERREHLATVVKRPMWGSDNDRCENATTSSPKMKKLACSIIDSTGHKHDPRIGEEFQADVDDLPQF